MVIQRRVKAKEDKCLPKGQFTYDYPLKFRGEKCVVTSKILK